MQRVLTCLLFLGLHLSALAGVELDSLRKIWNDSTQTDSLRFEAVLEIAWWYDIEVPDSMGTNAQLAIDYARTTNNQEGLARGYHAKGTFHYYIDEYEEALQSFGESLQIFEELEDKRGISGVHNRIGVIYMAMGNYARSIEYLTRSLKLKEEMKDQDGLGDCMHDIGYIYVLQGDNAKAEEFLIRSLNIREEYSDKRSISQSLNTLGILYSENGQLDKAEEYFVRSLKIDEELEDLEGISTCLNNLGSLYDDLGEYSKAMEHAERGREISEQIGDREGTAQAMDVMANAHIGLGNPRKAVLLGEQVLAIAREIGSLQGISGGAETLYEAHKANGNYKKAMEYHELFIEIRDSIDREENQRAVLRNEYQYQYEKQALADSLEFAGQQAMMDLELEEQDRRLARQRIGLTAAIIGILLILGLAFIIFRQKRRSDELLLNILPAETARELKKYGRAKAKRYDAVTVLFTDFRGFSALSEELSPEELVEELNACFTEFDQIIEYHKVEKIKTIGDAYMAVGGLPVANSTHVRDVVFAAIHIQEFMDAYALRKRSEGKAYFEARVGVHTGPVVAGIVGRKKFQYDIWGDTVNTASRMESHGEVGKVNLSATTYHLVKDIPGLGFVPRGKMAVKGKSEMEMYFVELSNSKL